MVSRDIVDQLCCTDLMTRTLHVFPSGWARGSMLKLLAIVSRIRDRCISQVLRVWKVDCSSGINK
jgi:hypothetical protein